MRIGTTVSITAHLSEWLLSKSQEITNVGHNVEKREPSCCVGGNEKWLATMESIIEASQKIKNRTALQPRNSTSGYIPKGNEISILRRSLPSWAGHGAGSICRFQAEHGLLCCPVEGFRVGVRRPGRGCDAYSAER